MSAFKPSSISLRTLKLLDMMERCIDEGIPLHSMLRTLGLCVSVSPPPLEHRRKALNIAWRHIANLESSEDYISCAEPWLLFIAKNFTVSFK